MTRTNKKRENGTFSFSPFSPSPPPRRATGWFRAVYAIPRRRGHGLPAEGRRRPDTLSSPRRGPRAVHFPPEYCPLARIRRENGISAGHDRFFFGKNVKKNGLGGQPPTRLPVPRRRSGRPRKPALPVTLGESGKTGAALPSLLPTRNPPTFAPVKTTDRRAGRQGANHVFLYPPESPAHGP